MTREIMIALLSFAIGGAITGFLVWTVLLMGVTRLVSKTIRQGYFMHRGYRYNVAVHRQGEDA